MILFVFSLLSRAILGSVAVVATIAGVGGSIAVNPFTSSAAFSDEVGVEAPLPHTVYSIENGLAIIPVRGEVDPVLSGIEVVVVRTGEIVPLDARGVELSVLLNEFSGHVEVRESGLYDFVFFGYGFDQELIAEYRVSGIAVEGL